MELQIRNTNDNDYELLLKWWEFWRFSPPPKDILPNNGLDGLIIAQDDIEICAGFIYATSSPRLFWIEWIVSNPKIKDKKLRQLALITLIQALTQMVKNMGGDTVYTILKNSHLEGYYTDCGFLKTSSNNTEMIKNI